MWRDCHVLDERLPALVETRTLALNKKLGQFLVAHSSSTKIVLLTRSVEVIYCNWNNVQLEVHHARSLGARRYRSRLYRLGRTYRQPRSIQLIVWDSSSCPHRASEGSSWSAQQPRNEEGEWSPRAVRYDTECKSIISLIYAACNVYTAATL